MKKAIQNAKKKVKTVVSNVRIQPRSQVMYPKAIQNRRPNGAPNLASQTGPFGQLGSFARAMPPGLGGLIGTAIGTRYGNPAMGAGLGTTLSTFLGGRGKYTVNTGRKGGNTGQVSQSQDSEPNYLSMIPGPIGVLSKLFGSGQYRVQRNSLLEGQQTPKFVLHEDGVEICHREYFYTSNSSLSFAAQSFSIRPNNSAMFPWLATIADSFEQWEPLGLIIEYRPTSGTNFNQASSNSLGVEMLATQYDVTAPPFTSRRELDAYQYSSSCVPFETMIHPIECKSLNNPTNTYYILKDAQGRAANTSFANAIQLYDMGKLYSAVEGMPQAGIPQGELWVSYHIRLKKPRLPTTPPGSLMLFEQPTNSAAATTPLGTTSSLGVEKATGVLGPAVATGSTTRSVVLPITGYYLVIVACKDSGTGISAEPAAPTLGANVSAVSVFNNRTASTVTVALNSKTLQVSTVQVTKDGSGSANAVTLSEVTGMTAGQATLLIVPFRDTYSSALVSV